MNKKELYENKYEVLGLTPSPYFKRQFKYIEKKYLRKDNLKILDLGGGTGEYSLLLQELEYDVTLFDFSEQAIKRAKMIGVKSVICEDFLTYHFKNNKYDVVFVKGFSLLNTDNKDVFLFLLEKMKHILNKDGKIVYMGQTDLSGKWTDSGWYQLGENEITKYFNDSLLMPAFRYQLFLPLIFNTLITKVLMCFSSLLRSVSLVGIIEKT